MQHNTHIHKTTVWSIAILVNKNIFRIFYDAEGGVGGLCVSIQLQRLVYVLPYCCRCACVCMPCVEASVDSEWKANLVHIIQSHSQCMARYNIQITDSWLLEHFQSHEHSRTLQQQSIRRQQMAMWKRTVLFLSYVCWDGQLFAPYLLVCAFVTINLWIFDLANKSIEKS